MAEVFFIHPQSLGALPHPHACGSSSVLFPNDAVNGLTVDLIVRVEVGKLW
jgi:hypothetical protein